MMFRYVTHPNVIIDPNVPVAQWHLNEEGLARTRAMLKQPWVGDVGRIVTSDEAKAMDTAQILADHLGLPAEIRDGLGENDRSATGFLPPEEFEQVADLFFAHPDQSIRGWETAQAAQQRIVANLSDLFTGPNPQGCDIVTVGHGGVGTLLYCHLAGEPIDRRYDQPGQGHYFSYDLETKHVLHAWLPVDQKRSRNQW